MKCLTRSMIVVGALTCLIGSVSAQPQLVKPITRIGYPEFVKHGVQRTVTIEITNPGDAALNITDIQGVKSTQPSIDWLGVSAASLVVPSGSGNTASFDIFLNKNGVINSPGTVVNLSGLVYLKSDAPPPSDSVNIVIDRFLVADTVAALKWDTVSTGCLRLVVSNNGEMGRMGAGRVNMDFVSYGYDCDTAGESKPDVYLFDGGPVVVREITPGAAYSWTSQIYQDGIATDESFKPMVGGSPGSFTGIGYDGYRTGTFVNRDTTIGIQATYYAPTTGGDSCNFIIVKKQYFNMKFFPVNNVIVGEQIDWDLPSENSTNSSKILGTKTVYQCGIDTGMVPDCGTQRDSSRYAAAYLLGKYTKAEYAVDICANDKQPHGIWSERFDTLANYDSMSSNVEGKYFWNRMFSTGLTASPARTDLRSVYTYYANRNFAVNDTVTVYTALVTIKNGTESGLDKSLSDAFKWHFNHLRNICNCPWCCFGSCSFNGRTGNIDCDPENGVDISDLSALIDYLYISFTPPTCMNTANIDGDVGGGIDISDLSALIDFLYISFTPPAFCL